MKRILMVNGDELGMNRSMNYGIVRAAKKGILTQASLMLRQSGTRQAVSMARRVGLPLGLHLNLTNGLPCATPSKIPTLVTSTGRFRNPYLVTPTEYVAFADSLAPREVDIELRAQVKEFIAIVGRVPTHLDSHEVMSGYSKLLPIFLKLAHELGIPMHQPVWHRPESSRPSKQFFKPVPERKFVAPVKTSDHLLYMTDIRYRGLDYFVETLRNLKPGRTALVTHPASKDMPLGKQLKMRHVDFELITHPVIKKTLLEENIQLSTFQREFGCKLQPKQVEQALIS
jgi:predicted glycoside hydrolase/deacetylase ChbG (UPF0249 family)